MALRLLTIVYTSLDGRGAGQIALHRRVIGVNTADEVLFESAVIEDTVSDVNGAISTGVEAIHIRYYNIIA